MKNVEQQNSESQNLIPSVKYWLEKTIIGYDFCPFAKKEFVKNSIHYETVDESNSEEQLLSLTHELTRLDQQGDIATTLILLPKGLESFFDYLDFIDIANELLVELGYEGIYQLASFHPDYCFADVQQDDPSNYTNRSPVPIVHILREEQLEKILAIYPEPENIPNKNIQLTHKLGAKVFKDTLGNAREQIE